MLRNFPSDRNIAAATCPSCGAIASLRPHGHYERWLRASEEDDMVAVKVRRGRCSCCGRTHALLPEGAIPRIAAGVRLAAAICAAKEAGAKVAELCERFGLAARTLYRILARAACAASMLAAAVPGAKLADVSAPSGAAAVSAFLAVFARMPFEKVTLRRPPRAPRRSP